MNFDNPGLEPSGEAIEQAAPAPEAAQEPSQEVTTTEALVEPNQPQEAAAEAPKKKKSKPASKRIGDLTRQKRELERENERLRASLASENIEAIDDPDLLDVARVKNAVRETRLEDNIAALEQVKTQVDQETKSAWQARVAEFRQIAPDFDEVVYRSDNWNMSEQAAQQIAFMDEGPAVAYHLATNPALAAELAETPDFMVGVRLGEIASGLSIPERKLVSTAPNPVAPVTDGAGPITKDPDDMTPQEYRAWRRGQ